MTVRGPLSAFLGNAQQETRLLHLKRRTRRQRFFDNPSQGDIALPLLCPRCQVLHISRPIMQGRRIKVSIIRPNQRIRFRVEPNLVEESDVSQRAVQRSEQNRTKIHGLRSPIVKIDLECMSCNNFKRTDTIYWMVRFSAHVLGQSPSFLLQGSYRKSRLP